MANELITAPTTTPVTRQEVKDHLKIDFTTDDNLIDVIIKAAVDYTEERTFRRLITSTHKQYLDAFPVGNIIFEVPNVLAVSGITFVDQSGNQQTWANTLYELNEKIFPAELKPVDGESYPETNEQFNAVVISFTAGYGDVTTIPDGIKQALKLICAHYYENRDLVGMRGEQIQFPKQVDFLLAKYSLRSFI